LEWRVRFPFVLALGRTPWSELHFAVFISFFLGTGDAEEQTDIWRQTSNSLEPCPGIISKEKGQLRTRFVSNFAENNLI
jgi:hypothetical protein